MYVKWFKGFWPLNEFDRDFLPKFHCHQSKCLVNTTATHIFTHIRHERTFFRYSLGYWAFFARSSNYTTILRIPYLVKKPCSQNLFVSQEWVYHLEARLTLVMTSGVPWSQPPAMLTPHDELGFLRVMVTVNVLKWNSPMMHFLRTTPLVSPYYPYCSPSEYWL